MRTQIVYVQEHAVLINGNPAPGNAIERSLMDQQIANLLAQVSGNVYRIFDYSTAEFDYDRMLAALIEAPYRGHTRVREVVVGHGPLIQMVVRGASQPPYNSVSLQTFSTLGDAFSALEQRRLH